MCTPLKSAFQKKKKVRQAIKIFILLIFKNWLIAQPTARLEPPTVELGKPVFFKIELAAEPDSIDFSAWDSLVPPDDRSKILIKKSGAGWLVEQQFFAFDSGTVVLQPVFFKLKNGKKMVSQPLQLEVTTPPLVGEEISPTKDFRPEPTSWLDYLHIILPAVGMILAAAAIYFFLKFRKKKQPAPVVQVVEMLPAELALRKLEALASKQLWQQGLLKNYYSELTFIFREYLEKQFQIPALESTSDEILKNLERSQQFSKEKLPALRQILQAADLAKFAKTDPPDALHERAFEQIRSFIFSG